MILPEFWDVTNLINTELQRNQGPRGYRHQQAHNLTLTWCDNNAHPHLGKQVWQQVEALIRNLSTVASFLERKGLLEQDTVNNIVGD